MANFLFGSVFDGVFVLKYSVMYVKFDIAIELYLYSFNKEISLSLSSINPNLVTSRASRKLRNSGKTF